MGKPVFIFGAGSSIDAGLTDTYQLTSRVYDRLRQGPGDSEQRLLGYVIAKLIARSVRAGRSPFDPINIEDAYDGIVRLIERDNDLLSDFVYSWDPVLDQIRPRFDEDRFAQAFEKAVAELKDASTTFWGSGNWATREVGAEIASAFAPDLETGNLQYFLDQFLDALTGCLEHDSSKLAYMRQVARYAAEQGATIATLNYDLVVESALEAEGLTYDYGLSQWNKRKIIRWSPADLRILKLHGSINWYGYQDDIYFKEEDVSRTRKKHVMIFGSLRGKLTPDGPFLQLRNQLEQKLRYTNVLAIVGYSFRDAHMNALIKRWVSTKRKAKLVIVDPGPLLLGVDVIGFPYVTDEKGNITGYTVEIVPIEKTAGKAVDEIIEACSKPPNPQAPPKKLVPRFRGSAR